MRARRWVPAALGALLVVGVLGVRGGSAADEEDLRTEPPPPVPALPSPDDVGTDPGEPVLSADGMRGMRLGAPGTGFVALDYGDPAPGTDDGPGCVPAYPHTSEGSGTWDSRAWLVDDEVAAVQVTRRNANLSTPAGLRTWLGPTLGSPVGTAAALPGARSRTERPLGAQGPEVNVVVVPADGVEVVFSDAALALDAVPEEARGRITTIEVRRPSARACSEEALVATALRTLEDPAPGLVVGLDGLVAAPLGSDAAVLDDLAGAEPQPGPDGCEAFALAVAAGVVRVVATDGVVTSATVWGDTGDGQGDLPFRFGMSAEEVEAAVPVGAGEPRWSGEDEAEVTVGERVAEVTVGERVVRVRLAPSQGWVRDVDVPVTGGPPVVHSVTVLDAATAPEAGDC